MKNVLTFLFLTSISAFLFAQSTPQYSWRFYRPGNTGIQGDQATALWVDENGDPYIAAASGNWGEGGFARFSYADNKWINFSNVDHPILGSFDSAEVQITEIVQDYDNNLWMGNNTGALRFNPQAGISSIEKFVPSNSGLVGATFDIDLAPDSSVWFACDGLARFNPQTSQWTHWPGSNTRIAVQPKPDGSYIVWSADVYFGYVFTYNSTTGQLVNYIPAAVGEIAGLPGKDCVDDAGNLWALRMSANGDWETLEYQRPDGVWVYPTPPYENVSFYIDAFKAYGNGKALLVTTAGETWMFDGSTWQNYGTWRQGEYTLSVDTDQQGNVWVCGIEGAARRDITTGHWQRYRITNTSQIDYFVEDISHDTEGNVWFTGNAATGVGGIQKFDGTRWTGFNPYTYDLGYDFPFEADGAQAIYCSPSSGDVIFHPTFHGVHGWNGNNFYAIEDSMTTSKGLVEDSYGRLWSLGEYFNIRYYDDSTSVWTTLPIVGWGSKILRDPSLPGTIWALTDFELQRTDGINTYSKSLGEIPVTGGNFTGLAVEPNNIVWVGTWTPFTSTGSALIRLDANTGLYQTWSYDQGWPFPGEHVRPLAVTPDGRVWMQYDSEFPSETAGIFAYDGDSLEIFPASPGGIPNWNMLPNSTIEDVEVKEIPGGYELWMSCMGRGIAVLEVITDPVGVGIFEEISSKSENSLSVYPNPATEKVHIEFDNDRIGFVQLSVYDLNGKKVKDLINKTLSKGHHIIEWDLTNQSGSNVSSGFYFAKYANADYTKSAKIIVR